jgi:hypothetical protein
MVAGVVVRLSFERADALDRQAAMDSRNNSHLRSVVPSKRIKPVRSCPLCRVSWQHDRMGAPPKLCPNCRIEYGWCSDAQHAVAWAEMVERSRCRPCGVILVRRQQIAKRDWLAGIKLSSGCVDCGYKEHSEALDFDHRPGVNKIFDIGRGVLSRSWGSIRAEVAKCEVRCANCHRVKTADRRLESVEAALVATEARVDYFDAELEEASTRPPVGSESARLAEMV